ncbi:MAG: rhomboid family intramembrane serine protease [Paludibacter sp.]|nr:rhomboid family intramembrane serine protease [Paludibacter sp.]
MRNSFLSNIPVVTKNLIIINFIIWLAANVLSSRGIINLNATLGLYYLQSDKFNAAQLLTYMFLHGSFGHIFFNMFALFMFGAVIERFFGSKRFLIYYFVCGLGAGLVQEIVWYIDYSSLMQNISYRDLLSIKQEGFNILQQNQNYIDQYLGKLNLLLHIPTIGASGAVFGLLLAFGWFFPNQKIYLYFIFPLRARVFVILYGILELFFGVANFRGDNVAHFAHLGGLVFGLILIFLWRKKITNTNNYY